MLFVKLGTLRPHAILFVGTILAATLYASLTHGQSSQSSPRTVVFICQHGAAKSVIAAAYFNKLAIERHLNFHAIARGVEPQADVSPSAVAGLQKDGVPTPEQRPRALKREDLRRAARIVAFCPLPAPLAKERPVDSFDVPSPSDGYERSRDAILTHVRELLDQLEQENTKK